MTTAQLQLIGASGDWKLDKRTIEIGKAGIAQAREALAKADPITLDIPAAEEVADTPVAPAAVATLRRRRVRRPTRTTAGQEALALFGDEDRRAA